MVTASAMYVPPSSSPPHPICVNYHLTFTFHLCSHAPRLPLTSPFPFFLPCAESLWIAPRADQAPFMISMSPKPSLYPMPLVSLTASRCFSRPGLNGNLLSLKSAVRCACTPSFCSECFGAACDHDQTGTVHLFDRSSSSILVCALPPPSPPPQPSSNWMGNLFAVLPFNRPAPPSSPQPAVADTKVLDAVSKFSILSQEPRLHVHLTADQIALPLNSHTYACTFISLGGRTVWMTVFAKSDFSFTCTVNDRNTTIDVHLVPQPDGYLGDMPPPDSRPDSACITCTTDGDKVVCAAAWVMHIGQNYKTYVRSFFVYEDPEQRGCLSSQEVFYERPKSSLHAVTCLSIQCGDDGAKNRLCLVGSSPPAQSPASQEARNCSQKHVTAVEIIVMRKFGTPGIRSATCMLVHGLSNQMRDDINFLQSDLSKVLEQRAKTVSGSGALHSAGGSGSLSRIFAQYLQQSQWWQVNFMRLHNCAKDFCYLPLPHFASQMTTDYSTFPLVWKKRCPL